MLQLQEADLGNKNKNRVLKIMCNHHLNNIGNSTVHSVFQDIVAKTTFLPFASLFFIISCLEDSKCRTVFKELLWD